MHGGGRGFFGKLAAIRAVPGCHAALREFFRAKFHPARFESCCLDGAAFYEAKPKALAFAGGSLAEAELGGMPLKGIDLRSTDIRGIRLTGGELKGAIVSPVQAMELARLLGVEIRE